MSIHKQSLLLTLLATTSIIFASQSPESTTDDTIYPTETVTGLEIIDSVRATTLRQTKRNVQTILSRFATTLSTKFGIEDASTLLSSHAQDVQSADNLVTLYHAIDRITNDSRLQELQEHVTSLRQNRQPRSRYARFRTVIQSHQQPHDNNHSSALSQLSEIKASLQPIAQKVSEEQTYAAIIASYAEHQLKAKLRLEKLTNDQTANHKQHSNYADWGFSERNMMLAKEEAARIFLQRNTHEDHERAIQRYYKNQDEQKQLQDFFVSKRADIEKLALHELRILMWQAHHGLHFTEKCKPQIESQTNTTNQQKHR